MVTRRCGPTLWTSACHTPRDPENPQTSHRDTLSRRLYLQNTFFERANKIRLVCIIQIVYIGFIYLNNTV